MQGSNILMIFVIGIGILIASKIIVPLILGMILFAVYVFIWVMLKRQAVRRKGSLWALLFWLDVLLQDISPGALRKTLISIIMQWIDF